MKKIALIILSLIASTSWASPSVTSVSGALTHKSAVTVSGSGFGTKVTPAPLRYDDFEAGTVGHEVQSDFPYWTQTASSHPTISNDHPRGAELNSSKHYLKAANDSSETGGVVSIMFHNNVGFASTHKIYINYWTWFDWGTAPTTTGFQLKTLTMCNSLDATANCTYPSLAIFNWTYTPWPGAGGSNSYLADYWYGSGSGDSAIFIRNGTSTNIMNTSGWYNVALQINMGTPGQADGSHQQWVSDVASASTPTPYGRGFHSSTDGQNYPDGVSNIMILGNASNTNLIDAIKIGWYRGYTNPGGETTLYYDNIYIDNSWARVEIGDNAVYDNCTHREIQIPTTWSDTSITVTANAGSFAAGAQVYVFVVDENGAPSAGYGPVTIGSGGPIPRCSGGTITGGVVR